MIHDKAMTVWNTWISSHYKTKDIRKRATFNALMDIDIDERIEVLEYIKNDLRLPDIAWTLAVMVIENFMEDY